MTKFERYDARDDAQFFDGGELDDEAEEGSRLPLLLVIGLLVVGAFGGVVWLAYQQGVERGREDAPRMMVAAANTQQPRDASGGQGDTTQGQGDASLKGLKIYQSPAPADDDSEDVPQPPTPKATAPVKVADAASAAQAATGDTAWAPDATQPPATKPPRALQPPPSAAATPAAPPPAKPQVATASLEAAPGDTLTGVALQIGSFRSEAEANASWQTFSHRHPMVAAYQSDILKVDLGDKGTWYRLRLGGFTDKAVALAFCDKLKADGGNCILAH